MIKAYVMAVPVIITVLTQRRALGASGYHLSTLVISNGNQENKFCQHCGALLPPSGNFCSECGTKRI